MLRVIAIGLALMAAAKLGLYAYFYHTSTSQIIVATFRDRAIEACSRHALDGPLRVPPQAWSAPSSVDLAIGKRDLDVPFWQITNRLWDVRFRDPFLVVTADATRAYITCEYDVVRGQATVSRL